MKGKSRTGNTHRQYTPQVIRLDYKPTKLGTFKSNLKGALLARPNYNAQRHILSTGLADIGESLHLKTETIQRAAALRIAGITPNLHRTEGLVFLRKKRKLFRALLKDLKTKDGKPLDEWDIDHVMKSVK